MKKITLLTLLTALLSFSATAQKAYNVVSPDGTLKAEVTVAGGKITYTVSKAGVKLLNDSEVAMTLSDGTVYNGSDKLQKTQKTKVSNTLASPLYKKSHVKEQYNQLSFNFKTFDLQFRAYDAGIAYRFVSKAKAPFKVASETAQFAFAEDWNMYVPYVDQHTETLESQYFNSFEGAYDYSNLSGWNKERIAFLPLMVEGPNGYKINIMESDLLNYPGMYLYNSNEDTILEARFAPYPKEVKQGGHNKLQGLVQTREDYIAAFDGATSFPWRIICVSEQDKDMLDNDLVWLLGQPADPATDWSWIKPGKVAWEWWNHWHVTGVDFEAGVNNDTYKYYIDFASRNGIEYVILDEGWAVKGNADLFDVVPEIDIAELVAYGAERNVGIVLWAGYWAFDKDMDKICEHYSKLGVKGWKVDFMDRDDQYMVDFYTRVAKTAAKYHQFVDFHGAYKPCGLNRAYPNVLNFEGVDGLERMKSARKIDQIAYDVTFPYIRMAAGSVDYTQGAMRNVPYKFYAPSRISPVSQGTRCRQLAMYVIYESPFNMLCDSPMYYEAEKECTEFISRIPTVWDETIALDGKVGDFIVMARRNGDAWYIGGLTDHQDRTVEIDLSFLPKGCWQVELFKDGVNAKRHGEDYKKSVFYAGETMSVKMVSGGGFAAIVTKVDQPDGVMNVVPYPNDVKMGEGFFNVKGAVVSYDAAMDAATVNIVNAFAQQISKVTGVKSSVRKGAADAGLVFVVNPSVAAESYTLDITSKAVRVEASELRGFNYAVQTIKQMLPVEVFGKVAVPEADWRLHCVKISDSPRFGYRGLHLDEGRHFFGVEEVKRYLDIMEVYKLNKFHWHLTEDQGWRIEIKKYPRLTEVGAIRKGTCVRKNFHSHDGVPYGEGMWYTQDQIREIVEYAASKGIDVIPEIDLPGHMLAALAAYPELGCTGGPYEVWTRWGVSEDVLCAGNEAVYAFLEDVLSEVCELFPYEYFHVGGDECPKASWEKCPKCQAKIKELGLKDKDGQKAEHYLQSYVISRMEKFLNAKGKKVIGWDEILEGGIAPNATIMSWRGEKGGLEAARQGHDAIMTPNTYFYLDYYQSKNISEEPFGIGGYLPVEKCYSYEPYPAGMTAAEKSHIIGVQANVWTEYIATADHLYYMLLPRLAALAEVQWCNADRKDWERFYSAADHFCDIYETMGYNYAKHILQVKSDVKVDVKKKSAVIELSSQGDAPIYYTLDGKIPTMESKLYTGPITIDQTCQLNAITLNKGVESSVYTHKFAIHKAMGRKVAYSRKPHGRYSAGAPQCLVDGVRGPQIYKSVEWAAWHGDPVDFTVDMGQTRPYSSVTVGLLADKPSSIFFPERIMVSLSEDGKNFNEVAVQNNGIEGEDDPDMLKDFTLTFPQTTARYIKVRLEPVKAIPGWHYAAGRKTYVFVDELLVQ